MKQTEAKNILKRRYLAEFNGQFPIAIDDVKFTRPTPPALWHHVTVDLSPDNSQDTSGRPGNRKFLRRGILTVSVYTPINTGTDANDDSANAVIELFEAVRLDAELWTQTAQLNTIGSDGIYYQQDVVVVFEFEDIR